MKYIPISKPCISNSVFDINNNRSITNIIKNGKLTTGEVVSELESEFTKYIGSNFHQSVAVSNGTVALQLALECIKNNLNISQFDKKDRYIIVPSFSFNATANVVLLSGFKPLFVDVDDDGLISYDSILRVYKENNHLKIIGIIGVHLYGKAFDVVRIKREFPFLYIIEDCAQAAGLKISGKHVGTIGDYGCFSFYSTKNMTSGEGGMIISNSDNVELIKKLRNHGIDSTNYYGTSQSLKYNQTYLGYNYRMCEINAAMALSQLHELDEMNRKRFDNALLYEKLISNPNYIFKPMFDINDRNSHVFHQYTIKVLEQYTGEPFPNNKLKLYLEDKGIQSDIYYPEPLPMLKYYIRYRLDEYDKRMGIYHEYDNASVQSTVVLSIPVHPQLTREQVEYISRMINEYRNDVV